MEQAVTLADHDIDLPHLPIADDLFGQVISDHFAGHPGDYYLRRDDNYLERDNSARYFRSWEQMPAHHRCLISHARGQVLDLGAGAGQHALVLQQRGVEVTAIDHSARAIAVCKARGVQHALVMEAFALEFAPESFDTVLMMNNNLGMTGSIDGLRQLLQQLHSLVRPGGQLLTDFTDYTNTHERAHLSYHRLNQARGCYPGVVRMRVEYDGHCSELFDWLLIKLGDLRAICAETGWHIARCVQVNAGTSYAIGITRD